MARTVIVQRLAVVDQVAAVRSITLRTSLASAIRWRARIESVINALADNADQWAEADEAANLGINLRCRMFGRRPHVYRILFTIQGDAVFVHRVLHAAHDWLAPGDI